MHRRHLTCNLFPYTTLFRSRGRTPRSRRRHTPGTRHRRDRAPPDPRHTAAGPDRKSTRLNSSHVAISYAVFCLKKKMIKKIKYKSQEIKKQPMITRVKNDEK